MKWRSEGNLRLGSNVIELLLPHRRPFLLVDFVDSIYDTPAPTIEAGKHIGANEPVFDGHFPGLHIWPGTLTIEGMGQASALLTILLGMRRVAEAEGLPPGAALDALRNLNMGFQLNPGYRDTDAGVLLTRLSEGRKELALNASVDVKLHRPVFAGQRIDYLVSLVGEFGNIARYDAEARVDGVTVASGALSGARIPHPGPARR